MTTPPGFEWVRDGSATVLVRSDVRAWLLPLLANTDNLGSRYGARLLPGGRGGSVVVTVAGPEVADREVVVRACRRGGLPARVLRDTYLGWRPRPFRELQVTQTLRQRGAPVIEVYGAAVRWLLPGIYKGWLATRYIAGAGTLWEWASATRSAAERAEGFRAVGCAIRRLSDCGGQHPDLNLNNILVCPSPVSSGVPTVVLIDFDRARLTTRPMARSDADLLRMARSAGKLDRQGTIITAADLAALRTAYHEGAGCT